MYALGGGLNGSTQHFILKRKGVYVDACRIFSWLHREARAALPSFILAPQLGMKRAIESAVPIVGVQISAASVRDADDITHVTEEFGRAPGGGMIVLPNPVTIVHRSLIIALMGRHSIPAVYSASYSVRDGGLVSYGPDPVVQFRQVAFYVDQILKGAKARIFAGPASHQV